MLRTPCRLIWIFICSASVHAQDISECKAYLKDGYLTIENDLIERRFTWNNGLLTSERIADKKNNVVWKLKGDQPDITILKEKVTPKNSKLDVETFKGNAAVPPHLRVVTTFTLGNIDIRRVYRIYPGVAAIACDTYLRGKLTAANTAASSNLADLRNIETTQAANEGAWSEAVMDRLQLPGVHWKYSIKRFTDITDRNNTLVQEDNILGYTQPAKLSGSILMAEPVMGNGGLFLLKEAPLGNIQFSYPGADFIVQRGNIQVIGLGLSASDIKEKEWVKGFSIVTGVTGKSELSKLSALRSYQQKLRTFNPERDEMILLNTWGDRGQDARINEAFCIRELNKASKLGITHLQLDDGWQWGQSSNSASKGGSLVSIWKNPDYWKPHPQRFPNGLAPVVAEGKRLGVKIGIWFNPSADSNYIHWQEDANVLINLYRNHGIKVFKIDGVNITSKQGEVNLRKFFDTVQKASNYEVVFNLDVTAGRRFGYFYFNEYGNIFLENRYTDWTNYYPHWTLRNLWQLGRYVQPQNLQIEFLNKWRNHTKYDTADILAPAHYPFDYLFAITMAAQPLAWMETNNLPEEAFQIAPLIKTYKEHQANFHKGQIFPIGDEPDGTSWTGFQSLQPNGGYILIFREHNNTATKKMKLYSNAGDKIMLKPVYGQEKPKQVTVDKNGEVEFNLSKERSFAFYQYNKL